MTQPQYVTLQAWAEAKFDPVPHPNTLRRWAKNGSIVPQPFKLGNDYMVSPAARYTNEPAPARLVHRMTHGLQTT